MKTTAAARLGEPPDLLQTTESLPSFSVLLLFQVIERTVEAEDPGRRADAPESCPRGGRLVDRQMGKAAWLSSSCPQRFSSEEALCSAEICQEVSESQLSGAPTGEQADGAKTPQLLQEGCSADLNSLGTESTGGESGAVLFVSNLSKEASQVSVCAAEWQPAGGSTGLTPAGCQGHGMQVFESCYRSACGFWF